MTISSETRKAGPFTGNGVTTAFPFSFKVFTTADVLVVRTDLSGVETSLTLGTDYTVALNADQNANPGGTVNTTTALTSGYLLTMTSQVGALQSTDLTNQGGFYPSVITAALDKLTILVQQLKEQVSRAPKVNISSSQTGDQLIASINTSVATATTSAASAAASATSAGSSASSASGSATAAATSASQAQTYVGNIINNPIYGPDRFSGNGSNKVFTLSKSVTASTESALLVTISGVEQNPGVDYTASGTTLTFVTAPPTGTNNIRVRYIGSLAVNAALADTAATNAGNSATAAAGSATAASGSATAAAASAASSGAAEIVYVIDNGGVPITSGSKGVLEIPFNCTINSWTLIGDVTGSIIVDIKKSTFANFPTTTSITAAAIPTLSSAQKGQSSTLTGWTTTLSAGDILEYVVNGTPASITRATLALKVTKN